MKKLILPLLLVLASLYVQAQCVPGTLTAPANAYIIPDSSTNFVHGCPGQPYEQILYIKAAKDTTITIPGLGSITADIDSFVVNADIGGLPAYMIVESVPALLPPAGAAYPKSNFNRLVIKGDSLACVRISGNVPGGATPGTNNLSVGLTVYTSNIHSADLVIDAIIPTIYPGRKTDTTTSLNYYKIIIDALPCWPAAVSNTVKYDFDILGAVPNPTNSETKISFESNTSGEYEYKLMNNVGEVILNKKIKADVGMNYITVDVSKLSSGIYMFNLSNGKNLLSQKIQVNKY